jgi:hypothetical protein
MPIIQALSQHWGDGAIARCRGHSSQSGPQRVHKREDGGKPAGAFCALGVVRSRGARINARAPVPCVPRGGRRAPARGTGLNRTVARREAGNQGLAAVLRGGGWPNTSRMISGMEPVAAAPGEDYRPATHRRYKAALYKQNRRAAWHPGAANSSARPPGRRSVAWSARAAG